MKLLGNQKVFRSGTAALMLILFVGCAAARAGQIPGFQLRVLSSRNDMVSGDSALIESRIRENIASKNVKVLLNGRDVTPAFHAGGTSGSLLGRVENLRVGENTLVIVSGHKSRARLELINHPITGPLFYGKQKTPFVCQTATAGLGEPLDNSCSAKTIVSYWYKTTTKMSSPEKMDARRWSDAWRSEFKPYDPAVPRPVDMAQTVTSSGEKVDYIVRKETGTINRAIYEISFLHKPGQPLPDPWNATPGWNGRLIYIFSYSCGVGYRQGLVVESSMDDHFLSHGYAVAASSLNSFGNDCDDVISAETAAMVKEHFIKQFGVPLHTIGWGGSGGSMQQYLIAQNYPGILNGILPDSSFPDTLTMVPPVVDCSLLDHAFKSGKSLWTDEQKAAVAGYASWGTCAAPSSSFMWGGIGLSPGFVAAGHCDIVFGKEVSPDAALPRESVYDPVKNPRGVRCDLFDNQINVWGRNPTTGFARRPLDNVGVQYGLAAFKAGSISAEQFLELNEKIGGYDADGNIIPERMIADSEALRIAYQTGRVNTGSGGLKSIPIVDIRGYNELLPDVHDRIRSFVIRARLLAANGRADNQIMLTLPPYGLSATEDPHSILNVQQGEALRLLDRWLTNMSNDHLQDDDLQKVIRNKPVELADACWTAAGEKIVEPQTFNAPGSCNALYPPHSDPRMVAGAPLTGDVLKCVLKPVDPKDYPQSLAGAQFLRLQAIFPQGVCDYSRPGIAQQRSLEPWRTY